MANWMVYWRFETFMTSVIQGGKIDHTASQQYKRIAVGDVLWIVTLNTLKELILLGRQEVDRITDQDTAERLLQEDLWESDYHVITKKPTPKVRISFTAKEIARFPAPLPASIIVTSLFLLSDDCSCACRIVEMIK